MSVPVATGVKKVCCQCGRDVTEAPRMKDREARYWCVPCGEADRLKRMQAEAGICVGCGESVGRSHLMQIAGEHLCAACRKRKYHGGLAPVTSGGLLKSIKSLFGR